MGRKKRLFLLLLKVLNVAFKMCSLKNYDSCRNVGYVCMDVEDLFNQYREINQKQHFCKSKIKIEWYIKNIGFFTKDAKRNIPLELTEIIKQKDFIWEGKTQEIGTLRLMPKILKMK